jgi:hypothetical protein
MKYEGEVVMQAKGVKGLWFVEKAKRDYSSHERKGDGGGVASALWAYGV